jgi:GNAT superfamily N-acetyltransferase
MIFREATIEDIQQLQVVRCSVKENKLSNPALITEQHYIEYLTQRGKGWVCELDEEIAGFAVADLQDHNVWALFLKPEHEGKGIAKRLHHTLLHWYFEQTHEAIWLSTAFHTRAESFYRMQGWTEVGTHGKDEIKFQMTHDDWKKKTASYIE